MIQSASIRSVLFLIIAMLSMWTTLPATAAQGNPIQAAFDAAVGGETAGGVQLRLAPAVGAEQKAAADYLMRLALQIRNGGQVPVAIYNSKISGQVEFEIDGAWYRENTPTTGTGVITVAPGGQGLVLQTFLINDVYRYHGLDAIDPNRTIARLNLKQVRYT
jgi:hypothetical protein